MGILGTLLSPLALLLLITVGALYSEYAGRLALFLDGIVNLSAFLCCALTVRTGMPLLSSAVSCLIAVALVFLLERIATRCGADMFLASLAMNLFFSALVSLVSVQLFGTRGVISCGPLPLSARAVRNTGTVICLALSALLILILSCTRHGLRMRITGSSPRVLEAQGIHADRYRCASWLCAAFCGAVAGCTLCLRLSSFVPGMASGRGWTALAAVFLGRKKPFLVAAATVVFAAAECAGSYIQNIPRLSGISSGVLLALPYVLALILMAFSKRQESE